MAASLVWQGELRFEASSGGHALVLDGDSTAGPSPVAMLAFSLAGCMAMDLVDIIGKSRHPIRGCRAEFLGERADKPPRRFTRILLKFIVEGEVPGDAVERAIALSRERYCSVSNSLRPDIELTTQYEVRP